jgi:DTW domain-containing protein YfiP
MTNLTVVVGEELSQDTFIKTLIDEPESTLVIFPTDESEHWGIKSANGIKPNHRLPKRLIVLDGTWRKAKLLWHMNPWLHEFKTVALQGLPSSEYVIRSSTVQGGVSTLEAVMHACNYLTGSERYSPLLKPFKAMIDWQVKKMGRETFLAHYGRLDK